MSEPDSSTSFIMYGSREALSNGLIHVEEQVRSIEKAVIEQPALAFDLAKTLVESVCRTILSDRQIEFDPNDDLPKLFKTVRNNLPFLPPSASSNVAVRKSIEQTLSGLSTVIQGICELRNQCGFASHGSEKLRPVMESLQALMAAEAADTIVGFLYRVHKQSNSLSSSQDLSYNENQEFNENVDELHGPFHIFDIELRPSEVLYVMEPESYRIYLTDFSIENGCDKTNTDTLPEIST